MEATRWWQYGQPSSPGRPHAVMLGWVSFRREKVNLRKLLWEKKFGDKIERSKQGAWASLVAQMVKNLPAMQEMWVWSLGGEDSSGKRDDNPLQHSCLENPMDRGAWWAIVLRITKSQTRLRATITHTHTKKGIKNLSPYHRQLNSPPFFYPRNFPRKIQTISMGWTFFPPHVPLANPTPVLPRRQVAVY